MRPVPLPEVMSKPAASRPSSAAASRVFPSAPRVDRYFPGAAIEGSRRAVIECVTRGDGPALVIGAPGVGKSLLLDLIAQAVGEQGAVVRLASTQVCTRRALLQALLFAMGRPYRDREEGELRLAVIKALRSYADRPLGAVLIVDEAQLLSVKLLDEIRMLGDLVTAQGELAVRLVIAGGPSLDELLAAPELEPLCQRVATRCYVTPLTYDETHAYVRSHLSAAGRSPDRFSWKAIDLLYRATDGVPRLLNQLSQRLVDLPADPIEPLQVQQVWSELHQLPAPWYTPESAQESGPAPAASVEFAALDDLDEPEEIVEQPAALSATPTRRANFNADSALHQLSVSQAPTVDPFGDGWDEEELVIDRYASLGAAFHTSTPFVINQLDRGLVESLDRLTGEPDAEAEAADAAPTIEPIATIKPERQAELSPVRSFVAAPALSICGADRCDGVCGCSAEDLRSGDTELDEADEDEFDDAVLSSNGAIVNSQDDDTADVLVIEREVEPFEASGGVRRSEYRRLFANLRGGD